VWPWPRIACRTSLPSVLKQCCLFSARKGTCITEDNTITHRLVNGDVETTKDFLPLDRPVRIGVTSGASTPDSVVQEVLERIVLLKSLAPVA